MQASAIQIVGNWQKQVSVPLSDALRVSVDILHRSAIEACKHSIILMAQSAKALAPKSLKNRQVMRDTHGQYVDVYAQRTERRHWTVHKWQTLDSGDISKARRIPITWEQAKRIRNQGLAKRSWMWGLKDLNRSSASKEIAGVSQLMTVNTPSQVGYILQNKLSYVMKIMPAGWEATVAARAVARIMKAVERKIAGQWKRAMSSLRKAA